MPKQRVLQFRCLGFFSDLIRKSSDYYRVSNVRSRTDTQKPQRYTIETTKKGVKKMTENADVIFVGNKPPMSYVLAIITALSSGNTKEIYTESPRSSDNHSS